MSTATATEAFDWDSLVLESRARFTLEEALERQAALNAIVSDDEL